MLDQSDQEVGTAMTTARSWLMLALMLAWLGTLSPGSLFVRDGSLENSALHHSF
jgi:hypothetical protein